MLRRFWTTAALGGLLLLQQTSGPVSASPLQGACNGFVNPAIAAVNSVLAQAGQPPVSVGCESNPLGALSSEQATGQDGCPYIAPDSNGSLNFKLSWTPSSAGAPAGALQAIRLNFELANGQPAPAALYTIGGTSSDLSPATGVLSPNGQVGSAAQSLGATFTGFVSNGGTSFVCVQIAAGSSVWYAGGWTNGQAPTPGNAALGVSSDETLVAPAFTLALNPSQQNILSSATATASPASLTATIVRNNGFSGAVAVKIASDLACSTTGYTDTGLTNPSSTTFTCANTGASNGTHTVSASGTNGSLSASSSARVTIADYYVSASPSVVQVNPGGTATYCLSLNGTPPGAVGYTVSFPALANDGQTYSNSAPDGIACPASASDQLTVNAGNSDSGSYPLGVTATSGADSASTTVTLNVRGFSLSSPTSSVSLAPGGPAALVEVDVTRTADFSDSVALSVSGANAASNAAANALVATFSPAANASAAQPSALALSDPASGIAPGTYQIKINGDDGGLHSDTTLNVTVGALGLSAPAAWAGNAGDTPTLKFSVNRASGETADVNLSATIDGNAITPTFGANPQTCSNGCNDTAGCSSTIDGGPTSGDPTGGVICSDSNGTCTVNDPAGALCSSTTGNPRDSITIDTTALTNGDHTLVITGSDGTNSASASVKLGVGVPFVLTASPASTMVANGNTGASVVTATFNSDSSSEIDVQLTAGGVDPSWISWNNGSPGEGAPVVGGDGSIICNGADPTDTACDVNGSGSPAGNGNGNDTLNIAPPALSGSSNPVGAYTITVTGASGSSVDSTTISLAVI